ncbi:hypothetical protein LIPSTDRAFT_142613 [Lipomyces starkeyi NRRL Y-11557]|uniref:CxC1-like cysteine cluster associated with KDZ transposases domain-containing protein n=1 Tax=Lipomyces starkeyi NRRL Y-11557 TaxID=675824 RepID=A0A1E3QGD1_LIPST|nr:hypothetical protein LIPSTDRAFT_142613 [Lipomyces starkeyi NRRL Y-11557]
MTNENCDENPLDTLPEDLTADAIINVGKILSQRNTEKRQRHSDAWSKIFEEAVDTYLLWQPSAPEPLKCHNSRACLLVDSNSKAQYIQLPQNNRVIQLIRLGYMTNAPVRPTVAFSFELLKLFHMLKNTGGLSAEAFAKVLRLSLEQLYLLQFPDFDKRFRDTYYRWLRMHQEA